MEYSVIDNMIAHTQGKTHNCPLNYPHFSFSVTAPIVEVLQLLPDIMRMSTSPIYSEKYVKKHHGCRAKLNILLIYSSSNCIPIVFPLVGSTI